MRVAIVTGASSGLGVEFTKTIINKYKDLDEIWIVARRKERLIQIAHEYKNVKKRPVPNQAVYSVSKKYVYYFGKALREEMKKAGINVLTLCPGNMDTEMNPRGKMTHSKQINLLPYLDMKVVTERCLKKAESGKAVYTPGGFYKFYRICSKIAPSAFMVKVTKKFF